MPSSPSCSRHLYYVVFLLSPYSRTLSLVERKWNAGQGHFATSRHTIGTNGPVVLQDVAGKSQALLLNRNAEANTAVLDVGDIVRMPHQQRPGDTIQPIVAGVGGKHHDVDRILTTMPSWAVHPGAPGLETARHAE